MEFTLLSLFWTVCALAVLISHFVLSGFESKVPDVIKAAYLFGKLKKINKLETKTLFPVPKSWFTHFYAFGITVHSGILTALVLHITHKSHFIIGDGSLWEVLHWPQSRVTEQNGVSLAIVFVAEWIQMGRRLYECLYISSFSKGTMGPIHYFFGTFLYTSFGIGLLSSMDLPNLTFVLAADDMLFIIPAILIFLPASILQHKALQTFASLRRTDKGKSTEGHYIPHGHLFRWVSCPHYLCEMLIYLSLCLVFKMNSTYLNSILAFVVVNQISSSILSHTWYRQSFKNYPVDRKAVLPYLL